MDNAPPTDTLDTVISAAARFESEIFKLRTELDRLIARSRRGKNIADGFNQLKASAERAAASAARTAACARTCFAESHPDQA